MSNTVRTIFSRVLSGLTLLGAFALAVLPMGQMPKLAGPCGKALCYCLQPTSHCELCPITQEPVKPKWRWVLSDSQMKAAEPGLAFHPVFTDLGLQPAPEPMNADEPALVATAFNVRTIDYDSRWREIPTPPPKA